MRTGLALIFPDSLRYLQFAQRFATGHWSPDTIRPSGYSILITPAAAVHMLALIPLAQHVLGLAEGAMIYAVLVHRGCRRWLAALAAVPVLFDPLQLDLEQYVLSDVLAAFFVVTALVILVWRGNRAGWAAITASGLLLAAAGADPGGGPGADRPGRALPRGRDEAVAAPGHVRRHPGRLLPAAGRGLRGLVRVLPRAMGSHQLQRDLPLRPGGPVRRLYRDAAAGLYERPLCPAQPPAQRNYDFYMWSARSPQWQFRPPPGMTRQAVVLDFSRRVLAHQPLSYLAAVATDAGYGFAPVRGNGPERYPASYLKFQTGFPPYAEVETALHSYGRTGPQVQPALAAFLTGYGRFCYLPGPVLAAGLLAGLAGLAGTRRSRRRGARSADLLFTAGAIAAVAAAAAFAPFDWRYQLPQLTLIPVAAAFGVMALTGWAPPGRERAGQPAGSPAAEDPSPVARFSGSQHGRLSWYHRMAAVSPAAKDVRGR